MQKRRKERRGPSDDRKSFSRDPPPEYRSGGERVDSMWSNSGIVRHGLFRHTAAGLNFLSWTALY